MRLYLARCRMPFPLLPALLAAVFCAGLAVVRAAPLRIDHVEPTVFFTQSDGGLQQAVNVMLTSDVPTPEVALAVDAKAERTRIELGDLAPGSHTRRVFIPEIRRPGPVRFTLLAQRREADRRTVTLEPGRRGETPRARGPTTCVLACA